MRYRISTTHRKKILEALYDRLDLKVVTADIAERDNRLAMLRKKAEWNGWKYCSHNHAG